MKTNRPILVAVGGDSGTGKTTLVSGLYRIFGSERITNICLDDYHKLDRAARKRLGVTALNPLANDLELMADHIGRLQRGETIEKPTYDHSTGAFGPAETVVPRDIVVIRGLFPLFTADLREAFDVRIWLDPQEELKWSWKVRRDCAQRGYSVPEVIRQLMDRRDDQLAYIAPQRSHADLIIRFEAPPGYVVERIIGPCWGITVRSRSIVGTTCAGCQTVFGGEITMFTELAMSSRNEAMNRLEATARQLGGNCILGMRFDSSELMQNTNEIVAYGTAAVIRPAGAA